MLLRPASSIHTAFMRFAIDAVFVDKENRVVKGGARDSPLAGRCLPGRARSARASGGRGGAPWDPARRLADAGLAERSRLAAAPAGTAVSTRHDVAV